MSQHDPPRVLCSACRANNFPGHGRCWQCGHPLAAQTGPAAAPWQPPAPPRARRARWVVPVIAAALLAGLAAGFWLGARARSVLGAPGPGSALRDLERRAEEMRTQGPPPVSDPSVLDPDSETARARREIRELERRYNLGGR